MNKPSTMLGLAIGDALGQPFEFFTSQKILESNWQGDFLPSARGYKDQFKLDAGQWTDDTKMAMCIANSLIESGKFDADNLAAKYVEWFLSGDLRGIGGKTKATLANMERGVPPLEAAKTGQGSAKPVFKRISEEKISPFCGCGTVMRCAPIGLFFREDLDKMLEAAKLDATMTHDHPDARDASVYLCYMVSSLASGFGTWTSTHFPSQHDFEADNVKRSCDAAIELAGDINGTGDRTTSFVDAMELGTGGAAHEIMATALYCFLRYKSFKDAVASAVLMGGDTDSRAAVVGAMAGTYYGLEGIPEEWIEQVEDSKKLQEMDQLLHNGKT